MLDSCDVLVIGGGPAGSSCARKLHEAGLDVLVLDKAEFPRDKVCAGWITPPILDALGLDPADYARDRVFQPIRAFRAGSIGGPLVDVDFPEPVSFGIRRCEFDHYLLARCGARLRLGEPLATLERSQGAWVANGRYQAPMLVGAGGHFCPVAQKLGSDAPRSPPVVAAQEIEFPLDLRQQAECPVEGSRPELYFCRDLMGYGWCFRKGDFLNVGLGREDPRRLSAHVTAFYEYLKREGRIPRDAPGRMRGHAYLLFQHSPRELLRDGVVLVGDAAGLAYTQSGEGIRPAIESGLLAAGVILQAAGDYRRQRLAAYGELIGRRFGRRDGHRRRDGLPPSGLRQFLGRRLLASRWFVRRVVVQQWFLHAGQPPLASPWRTAMASVSSSVQTSH
jgi:geranylgeranyl reductase family protein